MKIPKPFKYMGSKGRFYNEIKEIFINSKKKKYVDLFAGGMEVAINLNEELKNIEMLINVKDEHIESLIKLRKKAVKIYIKVIDFLYQDIEKISSKNIFQNDKKSWEIIKAKYKEFWKLEAVNYSADEKNIVEFLLSMNKGKSLSASFYSKEKIKKLEVYLEKMESLKITHKLFDEKWEYTDSFILLDPPYLMGTDTKKIGEKGYNYDKSWFEKDDERLIIFIKNNLNKGNIFLVFGSLENNLSKLIQKEFKGVNFIVKRYQKSIFGISKERAEWYCIIK